MEETPKLLSNDSTMELHQKKDKYNPIGNYPKRHVPSDDNPRESETKIRPNKWTTPPPNYRRPSQTASLIQHKKQYTATYGQPIKQNLTNYDSAKSKDFSQRARIHNIYRWKINKPLVHFPSPYYMKKDLFHLTSNPSSGRKLNYLLQLYQKNFYTRIHYHLTLSRTFEECIQNMDQDMYSIYKLIKKTEWYTKKAQQKYKRKQTIKRGHLLKSHPKPTVLELQGTKFDHKVPDDITSEEMTIEKQSSLLLPSDHQDCKIEDITNTMQSLELSQTEPIDGNVVTDNIISSNKRVINSETAE